MQRTLLDVTMIADGKPFYRGSALSEIQMTITKKSSGSTFGRVEIQVSNDKQNWISLGIVLLQGGQSYTVSDTIERPYAFIRARVTALDAGCEVKVVESYFEG